MIFVSFFVNSCSLIYEICDYCNLEYDFMEDVLVTDDYNYSYHQTCFDLYEKPKKSFNKRLVTINSDISDIMESIKKQLSIIGINFKDNSINPLLETLSKHGKTVNDYDKKTSKIGVHKFDDNIIVNVVPRDADVLKSDQFIGGFAGGKAMGNSVVIGAGYSELVFKGILAHELTHVWQYQNKILSGGTRRINVEGLAELVQAHIFKMDTTNFGKSMYKSQKYQRYKVYREGYKKMKYYLELYGWKNLLERYTYYYLN